MNSNETVAEIIARNAKKHSEGKKRTDKIVRLVFLVITVLCASVIVIVLGFILIRGLKPFFIRYTEHFADGKVGKGSASFGYFFSGTLYNGGFDFTTNKFLYGIGHLIVNTLILDLYTFLLAIPTSVLTALFISRIAPKPLAAVIKSGVDLLAAIPSVIFGVFGMGVIVPIIRSWA